jgi:hypothetical protein
MKLLVVGGTSGIGKVISDHYDAVAISSRTGHAIPEKLDEVITMSTYYDVIVKCLPDENQNILLEKMYKVHDENKLTTHLITFGSMSYKINDPEHSKNKLLKFADSVILNKTTVKHTLINPAWCFNAKDEPQLSVITQNDITTIIDFVISFSNNTVISQIEMRGM